MFMVYAAIMLAAAPSVKAQWVVTDPTNLASGILNSANEIVQTSSTVSNVVKNFKEVEKVYNQGKEYYDKLKAVSNLVKDARKVQQTVLLVGDVSEMYVTNFGKMMNDPQWQLEEFKAFLDPYRTGLPADVEQQLTNRYTEIFNIFYKKRDKIDRVTMWGLHDGLSWKNGNPVPGRTNYPLLFNRDRTPKPAFNAVVNIPK